MNEELLPAVNAGLNAVATTLLLVGYILMRRGRIRAHAGVMISAFFVSAVFLFFYLLHKYLYGDRGAPEELGVIRWIYLFGLLMPHVVLAMVMLPMIILTFLRTWWRQWEKHRRIAVPTYWIWLYVSVSGVLIYALLYHVFPRMMESEMLIAEVMQ